MTEIEQISIEELQQFLETKELQKIFNDYIKASEMVASAGFNIFKIISDYYYRENFHGDILMAFIDPKGEHGEGYKFLNIFIEMIGVEIDNYGHETTVEREVSLTGEDKGRMDFVIRNKDKSNPRCIIVENKLYDAQDMPRQLIRYNEEMSERQRNEVDAIVYIPLSVEKRPEDFQEIEDKLKIVPAITVSDSELSLVKNWIDPCIEAASNIDSISILRQYKRLLISLKPELAKYRSTMDFIEFLRKSNRNFEKAVAARNLLNKMNIHLGERLACLLREKGIFLVGPDKEGARTLYFKNGYSLWIYCAATDNLEYEMKIVEGEKNYPHPDSIEWLSDPLKANLKAGIKVETEKTWIYFQFSKEGDLIKTIEEIVLAANSYKNQ